jgi:hypothetical protein
MRPFALRFHSGDLSFLGRRVACVFVTGGDAKQSPSLRVYILSVKLTVDCGLWLTALEMWLMDRLALLSPCRHSG